MLSVIIGLVSPRKGCYCALDDSDGDLCCREDASQMLCPGECVCSGEVRFIHFQITHICQEKTYGYSEDAVLATVILGFIAIMGLAGSLCALCNMCFGQENIRGPTISIVQMESLPPAQGHPPPTMYYATGYPVPEGEECHD